MEIFRTRSEVINYLEKVRDQRLSVGLVPTMGALHEGHLSLIRAAREKSDITVCSIFVNPTQFNDKKDLENYPRPVDSDIKKLEEADCDVLFLPGVDEMYSSSDEWHIELDNLDQILEGEIRPGHYQGVTQIVKKLFDIIRPDHAFFGQKDFQQFVVISHMVRMFSMNIGLIMCPTVRESDGLAMSSRNVYLEGAHRENALALFRSLNLAKENIRARSVQEVRSESLELLRDSPGISPEYFEIYDTATFQPASDESEHLIALAAARVGPIRIIDNMYLR